MVVVSDTSAITNLYQIGLLSLLHQLYGEIVITEAVLEELSVMPIQAENVKAAHWIRVETPSDTTIVEALLHDLDLGEAESIALALEMNADFLIIDEFKGREIAHQRGVKIIGLLGILILAKQQGLIESVRLHVKNLRTLGFRLNQKFVDMILRKLGEEE